MHSILTVDDSASMREMVSFTLKSAGCDVVGVATDEEAVTAAQTFSVIRRRP